MATSLQIAWWWQKIRQIKKKQQQQQQQQHLAIHNSITQSIAPLLFSLGSSVSALAAAWATGDHLRHGFTFNCQVSQQKPKRKNEEKKCLSMVFLCFETHPQKTNICEFFLQISNIWKFTPTQQPPPTWVQCNHRPVALEASCTWCTPMILGKVLLVAAVVVVLVVVAMLLFFTLAIFFVWGVLFLVLFLLVFVAVFWSVSLLLAGGRNFCTTCRKHAQLSQCTQCAQRNIYVKIVKGQGCIICINTKQTITIYIYICMYLYIYM